MGHASRWNERVSCCRRILYCTGSGTESPGFSIKSMKQASFAAASSAAAQRAHAAHLYALVVSPFGVLVDPQLCAPLACAPYWGRDGEGRKVDAL